MSLIIIILIIIILNLIITITTVLNRIRIYVRISWVIHNSWIQISVHIVSQTLTIITLPKEIIIIS